MFFKLLIFDGICGYNEDSSLFVESLVRVEIYIMYYVYKFKWILFRRNIWFINIKY